MKPLTKASKGTKKNVKAVIALIAVIIVLLLGTFGFISANSEPSTSRVMRDKSGNIVTDSKKGKYTDEYVCTDFSSQSEAQAFYDKVGGVNADINRLDANKDGIPCESLPKGK